jgi:nitrite reductase (NADH) small subunit
MNAIIHPEKNTMSTPSTQGSTPEIVPTQWVKVCALEDIPRLGARVLQSARGNIAVFRNADDEVFALADECPHKKGPLSQGIVHGRHVTCPLHNWNIHLADGLAVAPDEGCAASFPAKIENSVVFVRL